MCEMSTRSQVLDFERESEYILVLSAQNPVALVRGRYGPASTATVSIYVDDVNEGPILSQSHYEVTVREGEEPGRVIATIRGYDPDSHPIRWTGGTAAAKSAQFERFWRHISLSTGTRCKGTQRNTSQ